MNKLIVLFLFSFLFSACTAPTNPPPATDASPDLIIYWGIGCPHCENVKNYIKEKSADSRLKISLLEVSRNPANFDLAQADLKNCPEIDSSRFGVPLAFVPATKKCLSGDKPIIDWLSDKLK